MYYTKDILRTLQVLGFEVRIPDGGNTAYCVHGIAKEELWLPLAPEKFADDTLEYFLKGISLPVQYFKGTYMKLEPEPMDLHPSDQY